MNKTEFTRLMKNELGMSMGQAGKVVDAFLALVQDVLIEDGKLQFPGFGTFTCTERAARKGRNPSTGESIDIAASNQVKFKVGATLKAAVNE